MTALIGVSCLLTGCATQHFPSQNSPARGRVILLRGLWDVFSLGLDDLAERTAQEGYEVVVARGPQWHDLAARETDNRRGLSPKLPLIVGGHSYGADHAIRFSQRLHDRGTDVDLLLLLDATNPPSIPANVKRCVHFYRPSIPGYLLPFLLAGHPVQRADGNSRTELENVRLTDELLAREAAGVGHFNIDASPFIHNLCLNEMNRVYLNSRSNARTDQH